MLVKGGSFGGDDSFLSDEKDFGQWYYRKDPTHVAFYKPKTFEVIASMMNWTYEIPERDVVLFKKIKGVKMFSHIMVGANDIEKSKNFMTRF